ncbi:MAG TPA: hypothetical protein VLQ65_06505 [Saliniramus sp.]|nr:hypothetical protein [Saliniramus sp.]
MRNRILADLVTANATAPAHLVTRRRGLACAALALACTVFAGISVAEEPPRRIGFEVVTAAESPTIKPGVVLVRYNGQIAYPMAENLAEIWNGIRGSHTRVVLDLDSPGGDLVHAEMVIAVLREIAGEVALTTVVEQGNRCLSACVLVYMQGADRAAGGATAWMFHGACPPFSNIPSAVATRRYLADLEEAGVATQFLCNLETYGFLDAPGRFWASGYELFHVYEANVITRLLEPWEPAAPLALPIDRQIRSR